MVSGSQVTLVSSSRKGAAYCLRQGDSLPSSAFSIYTDVTGNSYDRKLKTI